MSKRERLLAILLCGTLTGSVFFFLTQITLGLFASPFLAVVQTAPAYPQMPTPVFLGLDMLMGVWVIWIYSRLSQIRPGKRTGLSVATAWWAVKSLQSGKWIGFGFIPTSAILAPLLTSYCTSLGATLIGTFIFDRLRPMDSTPSGRVRAEAVTETAARDT